MDDRRAARHRAYMTVTFMCVAIIGIGMVFMMRGAWSKRASAIRTKAYKDPMYVLRDVFAVQELAYHRKGTYATLDQLVKDDLVVDDFLRGPVEGYRYSVDASADTFLISAAPVFEVASAASGAPAALRRFYTIDQTHTIRAADSRVPGPQDVVVWSPRDSGPR
jgi:hypothetical protein